MRRLFCLVSVVLFVHVVHGRAFGADLPSVFAGLQSSLVLINCGTKHGTGFIVASNATQSLIATAKHVVVGAKRIAINLNDQPHVSIEATLVKVVPNTTWPS